MNMLIISKVKGIAIEATVDKTSGLTKLISAGAPGKSLHSIRDEIVRWRRILDIPYREYLLTK